MYIMMEIGSRLDVVRQQFGKEVAAVLFRDMAELNVFRDATIWYQLIDGHGYMPLPKFSEGGRGRAGYYVNIAGAERGTMGEDLVQTMFMRLGAADHPQDYPASEVIPMLKAAFHSRQSDLKKIRNTPFYEGILEQSIWEQFQSNPRYRQLAAGMTREAFMAASGFDVHYGFRFQDSS